MHVLVCGGRDYPEDNVWRFLSEHASAELGAEITVLIHGAAPGADTAAAEWAARQRYDVKAVAFPANWKKYGKRAGPLRNERMLAEGRPDAVIAFPGGRGTANMIALAQASGVRIVHAK